MLDTQGRTIRYLRLSVTDRCNYRCRYCMGEDGVAKLPHGAILTFEELEEIARAAVACGVRKIRLTGGEPLVRHEIAQLCRRLRDIPGVEELAMTTNASLLPQHAHALKEAGLDRLNISLDTLQEKTFAYLTRRGSLQQALDGLRCAEEAGFTGTKLNVVLIGGVNDREIPDLVELTRHKAYSVRFIELMPIGECACWPQERFLPAQAVLEAVPALEPAGASGVTELYRIPGWAGTVGLIRPMSHHFCSSCDRIRVTADGMLKPCLHSALELPLRGLHGQELEQAIRQGILAKPTGHHMDAHQPSQSLRGMNEIGG